MALLITMMLLVASNAQAWSIPANPNPSFISDTSHVLSDEAHLRLDVKLQQVNRSSANEIAILLLDTLNDQSIEDVSFQTAKSWGVGKKGLDNGVLIVLAMKEHRSRIEVGKGSEGDLPDLKAADILHNVVRPQMQAHNVDGALSDAITAISSSMANHQAQVAQSSLVSANDGAKVSAGLSIVVWLALLCLLGSTAFLIFRSIRKQYRYRQDLKDRIRKQSQHKISEASYVSSSYSPMVSEPSSDEASHHRSIDDDIPAVSSSTNDVSSSFDFGISNGSSFGGGDFGGGGSSSGGSDGW